MSSVDLALRYLIIVVAWHLACAWAQTFQSPYPIADAFELAGTAEEQLFKSLGISWRNLGVAISKIPLVSPFSDRHRRLSLEAFTLPCAQSSNGSGTATEVPIKHGRIGHESLGAKLRYSATTP